MRIAVNLIVALIIAAAPACERGSSNSQGPYVFNKEEQPHIFFIVVDTLRSDHLSIHGYARATSPNLESIAPKSMVFLNAISPAPWTLPSFASILLSKHAFNHEMNDRNGSAFTGKILPEYLAEKGYLTVSVQTNAFVEPLHNGFSDKYMYASAENGIDTRDATAMDQAIEWLDSHDLSNQKTFMFIGLLAPHWPYDANNDFFPDYVGDEIFISAPERLMSDFGESGDGGMGLLYYNRIPYGIREILGSPASGGYYTDARVYTAAYDAEINNADCQIGRFIEFLKEKKLYDKAMLIITADHGENNADHEKYFAHGGQSNGLYNSLVHVPLIIKLPNQDRGREITEYVRSVDIMPTVLDYLGMAVEGVDGKSLMPIMENTGEVNYEDRPVLSYYKQVGGATKELSIIKSGYKLIADTEGKAELYDLSRDPGETSNLAAANPAMVEELKAELVAQSGIGLE
ncbi:MAG: sulfatase [Nitrospinae bacterium]|nr:sulfatase [Nitrospinota bacterium]